MLSAKTASPVQCRRELPLAEAFNERKAPFAERNLALGEGLESGSATSFCQVEIDTLQNN
jgi:hypothetical protein